MKRNVWIGRTVDGLGEAQDKEAVVLSLGHVGVPVPHIEARVHESGVGT